jgi:hypothetical protein
MSFIKDLKEICGIFEKVKHFWKEKEVSYKIFLFFY